MSTICKVEMPLHEFRGDGLLYELRNGKYISRADSLEGAMSNLRRLGATKGCRVTVHLVDTCKTLNIAVGSATLK